MFLIIFIWAIGVNWLAYKKGFYTLPKTAKKDLPTISHFQLFASFGIYLVIALLITPILAKLLLNAMHAVSMPIVLLTGLQFFSMLFIFIFLQLFFLRQDPLLCHKIWRSREPQNPIELDLGLGVMTWLLSFPIVTIISEITDRILKGLFGADYYEQTAVKFVKAAKGAPLSLIFALLSVLVLAPFIEEFLFRGVLQTHLKKRVGAKSAILISSLIFALFHFSMSQRLGNIPLLLSLLILGSYLGFLYERQGSLWGPIGLHMAFNAVSAFRILFGPEVG